MSVNKKNSDGSYNQYASKPYVTKDNIGLSKVENKNSEDIRGEITSKNVTDALGYTPVNPNPQFIYDTEAKMTKIVPDGVNKGIVAMIGGKTVKINQLIDSSERSITPSAQYAAVYEPVTNISNNNKHVYYVSTFLNGGVDVILGYGYWAGGSANKNIARNVSTTTPTKYSLVFTNDINPTSRYVYAIETASSGFKTITLSNTMLIDLTETFGAGKEPTLEQCDAMFPEYISYSNGQLWNAPVTEVTYIGKNRFDGNLTIGYFDTIGQYVRDERYRCFITELEPGTYTINGSMNETLYWIRYLIDDVQTTIASTNPTFNLTLTQRKAVKFVFRNNDTTTSLTNIKIQIERGSSATLYTPYHKTPIPIPSAILNLPDYGCSAGDVYNYVDFEEMVYHHKVSSYKIGDVKWNTETGSVVRFSSYVPKTSSSTRTKKIISDKYDAITNGEAFDPTWDNVIYIASTRVYIHDYKYGNDIDRFVQENKYSLFNYELAEEELIDISDILMPFMLESGGTITFENEHNLDVPNTVIYEKEMI